MTACVSIRGLSHTLGSADDRFQLVIPKRDLDATVRPIWRIVGDSGSGKTTLLNLITGLDWAQEGEILWRLPGREEPIRITSDMDAPPLRDLRRRHFGITFQHAPLQPHLTIEQNLSYRLMLAQPELRGSWSQVRMKVRCTAQNVMKADDSGALDRFLGRYPYLGLSAGEKQRLALAQAMVHDPDVLFADEPTANLDNASAGHVASILKEWVTVPGRMLVWVTHRPPRNAHVLKVVRDRSRGVSEVQDSVAHPPGGGGSPRPGDDSPPPNDGAAGGYVPSAKRTPHRKGT